MDFGEENSDNLVFTCSSLSAGCGIGSVFGTAILLAFSVNTYSPNEESFYTTGSSGSPELVYANRYGPAGVALLTVGMLLCPLLLLAITVLRRIKDTDLLSSDALGLGIVLLGCISGLFVGLGAPFAFSLPTQGHTNIGLFLFIVVPFAAVTVVLLLMCYRHHKESSWKIV
jgi:hypothetical protein